MIGANSSSHHYSSNNKSSVDQGRNNFIFNRQNINYNNNTNELYLLYQTPRKQFDQVINNPNNNNTTPFHFDFNQHFGNLWSAGQIPNNQLWNQNINFSPSQLKKSLEKSYKLTPISLSAKLKNISSQNNSDSDNSKSNSGSNNLNNNLILNINNDGKENGIKLNENLDYINPLNNNNNDFSKKNLYELFNSAKNEHFLSDMKKRNNNSNNTNFINNNNIFSGNNKNEVIKKKNINLQISPQFMFSSPRNIKKSKKIFECSGSSVATNYSNKIIYKKRRFRKNNDQLSLLKQFYEENKTWSKSQIKELSQKLSLKENKVYKWLWDQRNKEIKANKFVIKKEDNK
jgi:succinate dehydrogenase flavin-adding protein (antitoxin of CptAB toxin-antitoxin module)